MVNDELGHAAGDQLLNQIAQRLSVAMRHQDTVARIGGDEFVVVAEVSSLTNIQSIQRKILESFATPFQVQGHALEMKASVGHARYPEDGVSIDGLLSKADDEMYHLKAGKGRQDQLAF